MTTTANHLHARQFIIDERHKHNIFEVLEVKNNTHGGTHSTHLKVKDFVTDHAHELHCGVHHHIRVVEPLHRRYVLTHLLDFSETGNQYLSLMDDEGNLREDLYVNDDKYVLYLQNHYKNVDNVEFKNLEIHVTKFEVEPMHRNESELKIEKIVSIQGLKTNHHH